MPTVILAKQVIDGTGRDPIPNGAVVVENSRIVQMGPRDQVTFDSHTDQVIDTGDMTVTPGLIDVHCHLFYCIGGATKPVGEWGTANDIKLIADALESAKWWLSQGVTTVRDVATARNLDLGLRDLIAQRKVVGPRIFGAGNPICMTGRALFRDMGHEVNGPDEARRAAREQLRVGANLLKLFASAGVGGGHQGGLFFEPGWEQLTVEEMAAGIFEFHKAGRHATAHAIGNRSIKNALRAGVDSVEHCNYLDEEAIALMKERDVVMVPTLAVTERLATMGTKWGHPPRMEAYARATFQAGLESVAAAHKARIRIATGTDPNHLELMADELEMLHRAGLNAMQVIVAATRNGAELVRVQDRIGTLEPGKLADLIAVDGNPLEDLSTFRRVCLVMKEGQAYKSLNGTGVLDGFTPHLPVK